jgi:hypothetical protein
VIELQESELEGLELRPIDDGAFRPFRVLIEFDVEEVGKKPFSSRLAKM